MGIAAALDKSAHRRCRFRLAEQHTVHAAAQDLAELPGIEADIGRVGAVDRRLDDDRRRAVTRARRTALDEAAHIFGETCHVEGPVLHPDIDVIGPDMRVFASLRIGQQMTAVTADVIDRLILLEEFDGAVDAVWHYLPSRSAAAKYPASGRGCPRFSRLRAAPPLARRGRERGRGGASSRSSLTAGPAGL